MRIKKLFFTTAAALMVLGHGTVDAQDQDWYTGIGIGQSNAPQAENCRDPNLISTVGGCSNNHTSAGAKLFGGYQFNQYGAAEVSYVNLGKFTLLANGNISGTPTTASGSYKARGYGVDAVATWPITPEFGVLGRIGVFRWTVDASASTSVSNNPSIDTRHKATGNSLDFGVGVKYGIHKNVDVRAELQRFQGIGTDKTGKSDVDSISASLVYRFR
jgi:OOP family OmpA-OmpF porin